jgi:hypothetical protein
MSEPLAHRLSLGERDETQTRGLCEVQVGTRLGERLDRAQMATTGGIHEWRASRTAARVYVHRLTK